jgi:ubiquinone biosynthesis protein
VRITRRRDLVARALTVSLIVGQAGARLVRRAAGARVRGGPPFSVLAGDALADALMALGPAWIKAGQILAARPDLLAPPLIAALQRLFDQVPPPPKQAVEETFLAEFGLEPAAAFAVFEPEPVASASVAAVHRAWLPDGRVVAVKVLRPGIGATIHADLALARWAAGAVERLPGAALLPLGAMVDEIAACLERQLDLRLEAAANRRLRAALAPEAAIVIPRLIEDRCSASILSMEFIERAPAPDLERSLTAVLGALYRMIFVEGFVHCDLHPGNLRLLANGRAALLDLGFMAEMPATERLAFARFFYAMAAGDGEACAEIALETAGRCRPGIDREAFVSEVKVIVDDVAGATARKFSVARFVTRLFTLMRRHGVQGTTAFTMAIVALLVLEGLAKDADVDLDFQAQARPYLFRASLLAAPREPMTSERVDALVREQIVDVTVAPAIEHAHDPA